MRNQSDIFNDADREPELPRLLDVFEISELIGVPRQSILERVRAGKFPAVKLGRRIRFDPRVVDEFLRDGGEV